MFWIAMLTTTSPSTPFTLNFIFGALAGAFISALVFAGVERLFKRLERTFENAKSRPFVAAGSVQSRSTGRLERAVVVVNPEGSKVHSTLTIGQEGYVIEFHKRWGHCGTGRLLCLSSEEDLDRGQIVLRDINSNSKIIAEITVQGDATQKMDAAIVR